MKWLLHLFSGHWRGLLPLPLMLAGPVACSALALWGLNRWLADWPLPVLLALDLPILLWAITGAARAADRALREGGGFVAGFAGYAGAGAVLLAAGATLLAPGTPQRTLAAGSVPPRPAPAGLPEDGGVVRLAGSIGFDAYNALRARLAAPPVPVALWLDSPGGNIYAARGLARLVEDAGLATHAEARCYSACTIVFAAGAERSIGQEGALGFHRYLLEGGASYGPVRLVDAGEEEAKDRAYLARRGIAAAFIARIHQTPPDAIWRPSRDELSAAGMLTGRPNAPIELPGASD